MNKTFGKTKEGKECHIYTIENEHISCSVTDYGATLVSLVFKDRQVDIVQGFDSVDGYIDGVKYMGATIGRVCNRIGEGKFILNGNTYHTFVNNGPNSLHGGREGFDTKIFEIKKENNSLVCTYTSINLEEGYPGTVHLKVTYALENSSLSYTYEATTDEDTLLNVTNHSFFNLNGPTSKDATDHFVKIYADSFTGIDSDGLAQDEIIDVKDTPFDFRKGKRIATDIDAPDIQLKNGAGYDHHFNVNGKGMRPMVECTANHIKMTVLSDLPGFQLYTGNWMDGKYPGKQNGTFPYRSAVCFETQYCPNAINLSKFEKPILKHNHEIKHTTIYTLEESKNEN